MSVIPDSGFSISSRRSSQRDTSTSRSSFSSNLPYQLPAPFVPPSLAWSQFPDVEIRSRTIDNAFPPIPDDKAVKQVDPQDIGTPDSWVLRDSRMVRLTGKHPFNAEAKLNVLFSKGFLTPSNLFFVRNHGAVPHVDTKTAREWKIAIHGYE
ncbi:hypothetical protein H2248_012243 [Termitomyces sp. 'cryptogamus']|nr:hypothetical protein H2248_012243 [Termitomyces sp. 'cryptogamus']